MNTYFTYIPKELVYEIGYYLDTKDIQQVSKLNGYFNEWYFWENYLKNLKYLLIKPTYIMNNVQEYIDRVNMIIQVTEFIDNDLMNTGPLFNHRIHIIHSISNQILSSLSFKSFSVTTEKDTRKNPSLQLPELENFSNSGCTQVDIKFVYPNQFSLYFPNLLRLGMIIEVSREDVLKLLVYHRYDEIYRINY